MLEAKEVNFAYRRGLPVLNDIACTIGDGEFVALLGHNGSGKTTLSRLFMALLHPRSGQVLVDGEDIVNYEPADLADKIGYVFQNPDLQILEDTVFDEVAYGPRAKKLTAETIKSRWRQLWRLQVWPSWRARIRVCCPLGRSGVWVWRRRWRSIRVL